MISSVPSRCWEIASERISSSVITPPALRITWASPIESPRIGYGFSRASMQATIATFLAGGSGRSPWSKSSAKDSLFFRNSSMALILAPFEFGSYKHDKGDLLVAERLARVASASEAGSSIGSRCVKTSRSQKRERSPTAKADSGRPHRGQRAAAETARAADGHAE